MTHCEATHEKESLQPYNDIQRRDLSKMPVEVGAERASLTSQSATVENDTPRTFGMAIRKDS